MNIISKRINLIPGALGIMSLASSQIAGAQAHEKPNIVIIYADDLGYGDVSCYGATRVSTPNIDRIAKQGLRFTNAHCTSATSTPSRYSLLTGEYAWRKKGKQELYDLENDISSSNPEKQRNYLICSKSGGQVPMLK